jgi:hypothetical protein
MEQPSQTYTSIINALQGVKGDEIELTAPPIPIDPLQAESLSAYISSFFVPTYRTQWAEIDDQTVAPKPSMDVDASVPAFHEEAVPLEVIEEKWDIRIWAKSTVNGAEAPMFGFTMKPRITILTLYIHVWLLLPTTERETRWEIYHRSSDGVAGTQLSWRSHANDPIDGGDYIILGPNKGKWDIRELINQHLANNFRVMKNLGALMKKCCWTVDPIQDPMILRMTRGLQSIGRPKEEDIRLYYGSLVFPHPRQDAPPSPDSDDSSSDTAESIFVGEVPPVNTTALLMHLISTLREKCVIVQRKREEPFEIIQYPRPPTEDLVDRVQLWLQGLDFEADNPIDSLICHDEIQAQ